MKLILDKETGTADHIMDFADKMNLNKENVVTILNAPGRRFTIWYWRLV